MERKLAVPMRTPMPSSQCAMRKLTGEILNHRVLSARVEAVRGSRHTSTQQPWRAGSSVNSRSKITLTWRGFRLA